MRADTLGKLNSHVHSICHRRLQANQRGCELRQERVLSRDSFFEDSDELSSRCFDTTNLTQEPLHGLEHRFLQTRFAHINVMVAFLDQRLHRVADESNSSSKVVEVVLQTVGQGQLLFACLKTGVVEHDFCQVAELREQAVQLTSAVAFVEVVCLHHCDPSIDLWFHTY